MRAKPVAADEQLRLIMECRASGLTVYQWCLEHEIKPGTFYNWMKHLRQKGITDTAPTSCRRDPAKQEIVKIDLQKPLEPLPEPELVFRTVSCPACIISELPVIELSMSGTEIRIPQGTDVTFVEQVLRTVRKIVSAK